MHGHAASRDFASSVGCSAAKEPEVGMMDVLFMDASNIETKAKCSGCLHQRSKPDVSGMAGHALQPSPLLRARAQTPAAAACMTRCRPA
jgi:hypothetical protein